jgi:hypothetical protein
VRGRVGVKVRGFDNNNPRGMIVRGTGTLSIPTQLVLGGDFSGGPATLTDILFAGSAGSDNKDKVKFDRDIVWRTMPRAVGTPTVPAANTAQQYLDGQAATFVWSAGLVTSLEISQDNSTWHTLFSQSSGSIAFSHRIDPGNYYRWQGTSPPTIKAIYTR